MNQGTTLAHLDGTDLVRADYNQTSLMMTESDTDEEDVLFDSSSSKKSKKKTPNGVPLATAPQAQARAPPKRKARSK